MVRATFHSHVMKTVVLRVSTHMQTLTFLSLPYPQIWRLPRPYTWPGAQGGEQGCTASTPSLCVWVYVCVGVWVCGWGGVKPQHSHKLKSVNCTLNNVTQGKMR